jgi:hypothetical protein
MFCYILYGDKFDLIYLFIQSINIQLIQVTKLILIGKNIYYR